MVEPMTDEARIAKLTELARRVWPMLVNVRVVRYPHSEVEILHDVRGAIGQPVSANMVRIPHPKALDALEAALLVLADEDRVPLTERQVLEDSIKAAERDRESILRRYKELAAEPPAWVEKLAGEWEQRETELGSYARDPVVSQKGQTYGVCARELRARAKSCE